MIFIWLTSIFAIFAVVSGISFWEFMAGLGTVSAVIILVFKDTILGFVASIQVSVNDMVRIGDWITFQKYGADGDVIDPFVLESEPAGLFDRAAMKSIRKWIYQSPIYEGVPVQVNDVQVKLSFKVQ